MQLHIYITCYLAGHIDDKISVHAAVMDGDGGWYKIVLYADKCAPSFGEYLNKHMSGVDTMPNNLFAWTQYVVA